MKVRKVPMRRFVSFVIVLSLVLSLSGCVDKKAIEESVKVSVAESVLASVNESQKQSAAETTQKPTQTETTTELTKATTAQTTKATKATEVTMDAAARKEYLRNSVITIKSISASEPNYAGGVSVSFTIKNQSDLEIKYVYLTVNFTNKVGDVVGSEIGGDKNFNLELTGPIAPGESGGTEKDGLYWDSVIYNSTAASVQTSKMTIMYMDGSTIDLDQYDVSAIMPE